MVSEGKCCFCSKTYKQAGLTRHLLTHLKNEVADFKGRTKGLSYLVKVKAEEYFLILWVNGLTTYEELDYFLRAIWLECCGHMSSFVDPQLKSMGYDFSDPFSNPFSDDFKIPGEINKEIPVYKSYSKNKKIKYEYDFGSTTQLEIILIEQIDIPAPEPIILLSRNEPLEILCHICGEKPAAQICSVHSWEDENLFCNDCSKIHAKKCEDFEDYAALPIVNSPRMGVCAYEGGQIDLERNGVYKITGK